MLAYKHKHFSAHPNAIILNHSLSLNLFVNIRVPEGEKSVTKADMRGVDFGQVRDGLGDIPLDSHSRCSSSPNFDQFRRTGRGDCWAQVHCAQPLMPIL